MEIRYTAKFLKDAKRLSKKHYNMKLLQIAIDAIIASDQEQLLRLQDHALSGNWKGFRELHIQKDWLLIYLVEDGHTILVLTRTGTHQQLLNI